MITDNGVCNYLDCSTTHITEEDDDFLTDESLDTRQPTLIVERTSYGYWLHALDSLELEEATEKGSLSKNIITILTKANQMKCFWIKLDNDGFVHDDLPKYDW